MKFFKKINLIKYFTFGLLATLLITLRADNLSSEFSIVTLPNGDLIFLGNSCDKLTEKVNQLYSSFSLDLKPQCNNSSEKLNASYILVRGNLLPKWIYDNQFKSFQYNGPNCFNLALVNVGAVSQYHFSSQWELLHWLDSDYCSEVKNDQLKPGDVGVNFHDSRGPYSVRHAFVWLSKDLVYSKNSRNQSYYRIQSREAMDELFESNFFKSSVRYYRCKEIKGWDNLEGNLNSYYQQVTFFEKTISEQLLPTSEKLSQKIKRKLISDLNELRESLINKEESLDNKGTSYFYYVALRLRVSSLIGQVLLFNERR